MKFSPSPTLTRNARARLGNRAEVFEGKFEDLQIAPSEKSVPEIESIEKRAILPDRTGELEFDLGED